MPRGIVLSSSAVINLALAVIIVVEVAQGVVTPAVTVSTFRNLLTPAT
jgi:hypothetical protein